jgi:hypothetical protein
VDGLPDIKPGDDTFLLLGNHGLGLLEGLQKLLKAERN